MALNALPGEVLLVIATYVGSNSHHDLDDRTLLPLLPDTTSLCKLALCSRRLNSIVTPIIYRTIISNRQRRHAVPMLLKRTIGNPSIAKQVQRYIGSNIRGIRLFDMSSYTEEDYIRVQLAIAKFGNARKRFLRNVMAGHGDAVTALLFALLPNLKEVVMFSYQKVDHDYIEYVVRQASAREGFAYLHRLKVVHIAPPPKCRGLDIKTVLPYLEVPSLDKISLYGIVPSCGRYVFNWSNPSGTKSFVRHLSLICSDIMCHTMEAMLKDFPCLETLEYEYYNHPKRGLGTGQQNILTALSPLKSSLKCLVLIDNQRPNLEERGTTSRTLAEFEKLAKISANAYILVNLLPGGKEILSPMSAGSSTQESRLVNMLPRSLKHLELYGCRGGILSHIEEVIQRKHALFTELKSISLSYSDDCPSTSAEETRVYSGYNLRATEALIVESRNVGVLLQSRFVEDWNYDPEHRHVKFNVMEQFHRHGDSYRQGSLRQP